MAKVEALVARAERSQEGSGTRDLREPWRSISRWIGRFMSGYHILVASALLILLPVAHNAIHLCFALVLAFMLYPAKRKQSDTVSVVDLAWIVLSLAMAIYTFYQQQFQQEAFLYRAGETSNLEIFLGVVAIAAVVEASRRVMGWPLPVIALAFLLYGYVSRYLPGPLHTAGFSFERIINHLFVSGGGIWGTVLSVSARDVFMFVLFASFFAFSGVGETLVRLAVALFGAVRGGPAKVSIVASALFGTISGSAVANILTTGSFTIPMMKGLGYAPHFAGAVEA
ncbi:MAG: TRAP transporter large permease subunit, partial [Moorellaceae bacterium]